MSVQQVRFSLSLAAGILLFPFTSVAQGTERPAAIKALEEQGVTVMQEFDAGEHVKAFAGFVADQAVAIYVLPDGNAIAGTRLDAQGDPLDEEILRELVEKPLADREWTELEKSTWVSDGKENAPRIIYMFSDVNCPYCHQFSEAARPWIDNGKVQIRHLLVGVIKEDSAAKAAAVLIAPDQTAALRENERTYKQGGIKPVKNIPDNIRQVIDGNQMLMLGMGFRGTPGIVVRNADGTVQKYNGMPQNNTLAEVLGPR